MGDYPGPWGLDNRFVCTSDLGGTKVLEWNPRFTAILVVLVLVLTAALASGYAQWFFDNWEW
jgi:hypothetical protein